MLKMILVAFDGSESAHRAFEFALDIAKPLRATISILAVVYPPEPPSAVEMAGLLESATGHYERAFAGLRSAAEAAGVSVTTKIVVGHPAHEIVREATEEKADLIVMGHRGVSRVERWLMGSVSKRVMTYAPCSVTVVR